jgi:anti-anti-sigma regulatory factor
MLKVEGAIVAGSAALLESECLFLLRAGAAVVLDLAGVDFVDQEGVGALWRLGRAGVELCCRSGAVAGVLEAEDVRITLMPGGEG